MKSDDVGYLEGMLSKQQGYFEILSKQAEDYAKIADAGADFEVPTIGGAAAWFGKAGMIMDATARAVTSEMVYGEHWNPLAMIDAAYDADIAENADALSKFVADHNDKDYDPGSPEQKALDAAKDSLKEHSDIVAAKQAEDGDVDSRLDASKINADAALAGATALPEGTSEEISSESSTIAHTAGQCFLLYNMDAFSQYHRELLGSGRGAHEFYETEYSTNSKNKSYGYYSTQTDKTRVFLIDEDTPGTQVVNKLTMKKGADAFVDIKTHEYAQLTPLLRIYKVYRDNSTNSEEVVEIEFTSNTSLEGIETPASIGYINTTEENRYTRGPEAGVLSFDWRYIGTDPYTATREVEATLKLTAQHFSSLVKERIGPLLGTAPQVGFSGVTRPYRYLDLIVQADCRDDATTPAQGGYSPECYEIRVVVGYQDPGTNADMAPGIKDNIPCQKDILALIPSDHSFDYKDDGSIELTISLKGRTEQLMNNRAMNILFPSGGSDLSKIAVVDPKIAGFFEGMLPEHVGPGYGKGVITLEDARKTLKGLKNKKAPTADEKKLIEAYEREISRTYVREKQFFLSQIFDTLESKKAVHYYKMTEAEFDTFVRWQTDLAVTNYPSKVSLLAVKNGGQKSEAGDKIEVQGLQKSAVSDQEELNKLLTKWKENEAALELDVKRGISYFFLGDLLATVLARVLGEADYSTSANRRLQVAFNKVRNSATIFMPTGDRLSDFQAENEAEQNALATSETINKTLKNFKMLLGNITVEIKNSATTGPTTVNLAHIPISVDAFTQFMIDNVLSKDIDQYPYFKFVDNVLSSLVTDLLGSNCLGGLVSSKPRPQTNLVESQTDLETHAIFLKNTASESIKWKTLHTHAVNFNNPVFDTCMTPDAAATNLSQYFIITSSDTDMSHLGGDRGADASSGLLHLHFGADRGVVKNMKFNKTDQEFLPESRFVSEGSSVILNQLANVYDVSVEMVGNNLFKIGQYVYIEARTLGAGPSWGWSETADGETTARSWSNIMGLGGYHLITEVGASIDATGGYNTTIKARWVSGGVREDWGSGFIPMASGLKNVL
jgi:hypothetical protein